MSDEMVPVLDEQTYEFEWRFVITIIHDEQFRSYVFAILNHGFINNSTLRMITKVVQELHTEKKPVTFFTVKQMLSRQSDMSEDVLKEIFEFFQEYEGDDPRSVKFRDVLVEQIAPLIEPVVKKNHISQALSYGSHLLKEGKDDSIEEILSLFESIKHRSLFRPSTRVKTFNYEYNPDEVIKHKGIPLGISGKDENGNGVLVDSTLEYGGLIPGNIALLAAPAKAGKTTMLTNIGTYASLLGYRVHLYSLEMPVDYLITRQIASLTDIPSKLHEEEAFEIRQRLSDIRDTYPFWKPMSFYDYVDENFGIEELASEIYKCYLVDDLPDLVLIDYLDEMHVPKDRDVNEFLMRGRLISILRKLAKKYQFRVILPTQIGKASLDKKRLSGSDVYGAAQKIFAADLVVILNVITSLAKEPIHKFLEEKTTITATVKYNRFGSQKYSRPFLLKDEREIGRLFNVFPQL